MNEIINQPIVSIGYRKDLCCYPFCGGAAIAEYEDAPYFSHGFVIRCSDCDIKTPVETYNCGVLRFDGESYGWHKVTEVEALEQVITRWNRRVTA